MKVIVDTCVLLWMMAEQDKLSSRAKAALLQNDGLFVSAISAFEIAVKYKKKKLELPLDPWTWFHSSCDFFSILEVPLTAKIAALAPNVDVPHSDPFDRFIIASAITNDLAIVTSDRLIHECKQVKVVW